MAVIYLIRHGQASFFSSEYDHLSDVGIAQSKLLGKSFLSRAIAPKKVFAGELKRQQDTGLHCLQSMQLDLDIIIDEVWNEYNHLELIAKYKPELDSFEAIKKFAISQENPVAAIHKLINLSVTDWILDKHTYSLSWQCFKNRIHQSFVTIANSLQKNEKAFIFTSGGPITLVVMELLQLKDTRFTDLQEKLVNASVAKVLVGKKEVSLSTYNEHHHLEGLKKNMITYR